jgi:hypothetical protein
MYEREREREGGGRRTLVEKTLARKRGNENINN